MQKLGKNNELLLKTCRQVPKKNSLSEPSKQLFIKTNQQIGIGLKHE